MTMEITLIIKAAHQTAEVYCQTGNALRVILRVLQIAQLDVETENLFLRLNNAMTGQKMIWDAK